MGGEKPNLTYWAQGPIRRPLFVRRDKNTRVEAHVKEARLERSMVIIRGDIQLSEESITLGSKEAWPSGRLGSSNDPPNRCKD